MKNSKKVLISVFGLLLVINFQFGEPLLQGDLENLSLETMAKNIFRPTALFGEPSSCTAERVCSEFRTIECSASNCEFNAGCFSYSNKVVCNCDGHEVTEYC